ncbi:hypothetical protein [Variovorax sp. dw_954]|uniref:hypothetical protein n=1 Tax=Variovorax sp. dw_954 TaxID=2720078 RepID=UPI001BD42601|nr:hypothetical protein [Variovorax sp. dw_954]
MQLAVTALIDAARSRFATKASVSPVAPIDANVQPQRRPAAREHLEIAVSIYENFVRRSPLVEEKNPAIVDQMVALYRNPAIQKAAAAYKLKVERLVDVACYRVAIASAIGFACQKDLGLSSEVISEILSGMAEAIDDEIEAVRADKIAHDLAEKLAMARHQPLRDAVGKLLSQLVAERERLIKDDESAARAAAMGLPTRFSILRNLGMSEAQVAATEPTALSPEALTQRRRARIAEIAPHIEKLRAFSVSPTFDPAPLAGLGFDELIAAREGDKAAT